ncbi:vWA domain-containing protein [Lignipirellula cremea]|uniref:VWFA domain-containing protein n=1 Tax=Lignipirellula cremea TaxID=2528010 RepID=A0A518DRW6_9BACT|nr:hypothetical protein [Lignipirellula cremea]QDU94554.1 hypothetical protein Pla8534_23460 [Lignipirellula cremea]
MMDAASPYRLDQPAAKRTVPAWVLSALIHMAALLLLVLVLQQAGPQGLPGEPDRPAGIVLVQQTSDQQTEYFSDEDSDTAEEAAGGAASQASESDSPDPAETPLPSAALAESMQLAELDLPAINPALLGDPNELIVTPNLRGGGRPVFETSNDDAFVEAEQQARRLRNKKPSGPPGSLSLFGGSTAVGHSFVFVIDRSRSMGGEGLGALTAAQKELQNQLARLSTTHSFEIVAYHHLPYYLGDRRLLPATGANLAKVKPFFDGLAAFGGTDHEMGILAALRLEPDVLYFLADGGDPFLNAAQLKRIHDRAAGVTTIYCIEFGFGETPEPDNFMQQLAAQNGGTYAYINMRK